MRRNARLPSKQTTPDRAAPAIEPRPIESLAPNPRNARTHSDRQIEQIAASIQSFGFIGAVLIDEAGMILAGHGRVEAAKRLGLSAVPTIRVDHLSEAQKRAYVIADNRVAEKAGWDRETLAIEFEGLVAIDFDVELTGFAMAEIDLMIDEQGAAQTSADDEVPEPDPAVPPVSQVGDVWQLGPHRLICGDATAAET